MSLDLALRSLAIFPLPDVVLFPGTALPLHVFEPRYVEMTRDVVAGSRRLAIVRLRPGYETEYHGRPPTFSIATVGEVVASRELPGDRFALVVRGTDRIVIERELPPERSFRQVEARVLDDVAVDEASLAVDRAQLCGLCERVAMHLGDAAAGLRELVRAADATSALTLALASTLVADPDERQQMLELRDPHARLEHLIDHVSALLVTIGPGSGTMN
jgi:Lon protease-like protein